MTLAARASSSAGAAQDQFIRQQFDVLQIIRDNMEALLKLAGRYSPVEDLEDFRAQIEDLHPKLGLLVEASEIIINATDAGLDLLTAVDAAAQRVALGLGSAALRDEEWFATASELETVIANLAALGVQVDNAFAVLATKASIESLELLQTRVDAIESNFTADIQAILTSLTDGTYFGDLQASINDLQTQITNHGGLLDLQVSRVDDLEASITNAQLGIEANAGAIDTLTTQVATHGDNIAAMSTAITELDADLTAAGEAVAAHGSAIEALETSVTDIDGRTTANSTSIDSLTTRIQDNEDGLAAEVTARGELSTTVTQHGDDLEVHATDITKLTASLTGIGNQVPNAGFETSTRDWSIYSVGAGWNVPTLERLVGPVAELPGAIAMVLANNSPPVLLWAPNMLNDATDIWLNDLGAVTDGGGGAATLWSANDMYNSSFSRTLGTTNPMIRLAEQNGRRVMRFDGVDDYMASASGRALNVFRNVTKGWAFFVYKLRNVGASSTLIFSQRTGANTNARFNVYAGIGATSKPGIVTRRLDAEASATTASANDTGTANYVMLLAQVDFANADAWLHVNGVLDTTNLAHGTAGTTSNTDAQGSTILGADQGPSAGYAALDLAEAIVVGGTLPSAAEIDKLFGYAAHRWGLTANLPVAHPYKTVAPIADTDPYYDYVTSLMHFNGLDGATVTFDQKGKAWTLFGNAKLSSGWSRFGATSLFLDGSGDYAESPSSTDYDIDGDWTYNVSIKPTAVARLQMIAARRETSGSFAHGWQLFHNADGSLGFQFYSAPGVLGLQLSSAAGAIVANGEYDIEVDRKMVAGVGNWKLFLNGTLVDSDVETAPPYAYTTPFRLGYHNASGTNPTRAFTGYIDESRVTKGKWRHDAGGFGALTAAHPDTAPTVAVPTGDCGARSKRFPVDPNSRQIASTWLGGSGCTARVEWRVFNAAGAQVDQGLLAETNLPLAFPGTRYYDIVNVHPTGAYMEIQLWATAATTADAKAYLLRPMVEEAGINQMTPSPWTPSVAGIEDTLVTAQTELAVQVEAHNGVIDVIKASYTLTLDVNGYIAGWQFVNDGVTGDFAIAADKFSITAPAGYKSLQWNNGILSATDNGYTRYQGAGFGEGSAYIDWFGLTPAGGVAACDEMSAIFYIKKDGSAFFGGDLATGEGSDLVINGSFEFNPGTGIWAGANPPVGSRPSGGWEVTHVNNAALWDVRLQTNATRLRSGTYSLQFANQAGALAAGATAYIVVQNNRWIKALPGQKFAILAMLYEGGTGAWITGLNRRLFVGLRCYDKNKNLLNGDVGHMWNANNRTPTPGVDNTALQRAIATTVANTAYVRVCVYAYFQNTTGATINPTTNLDFFEVDDVYVYRWHGGHALTEPGSGEQIGDPRALNPIVPANVGSIWSSGTISYTASAGTPASATISVGASTLQMGDVVLNYNAMSVGVTGTNGATVKYYLYCDDPTWAAGARTLVATTSQATATTGNGRIYVGAISVTYPASGTGGGTPPRECIPEWALIPEVGQDPIREMGTVERGSTMLAVNPLTGEEYPARVYSAVRRLAPCVIIHTENGVEMPVSLGGRVRTSRGWVMAGDLCITGDELLTRTPDGIGYSEITLIEDIGWHPVVNAAIEEEGKYETTGCHWAGKKAGFYGAHHNIKNGLG